nr:unnamed protein product [Spirometra erinaceieuropaei]
MAITVSLVFVGNAIGPVSVECCSSSNFTAPTAAAQAAVSHITNRDTITDTCRTFPKSSDEDQHYTCPHCDRTFTSRIGLVGHLRIHRTETANQCLEHQPTPTALASNVRTALAPSLISWAYSATCASTRAELTETPTHPQHPAHPPRPVPPSLHRHTRPSPPPPPPSPRPP